MNFLKGFLLLLFSVGCFSACTKNGVDGDIMPTSVQLLNYYYSTGKTFSLLQGTDTVLSNIGFNTASLVASGAPGFYSLLFQDNAHDTILNGNINLQAGTRYSMFVVQDSAENSAAVRYSLVTNATSDKLPLYDSCKVRILDFARGLTFADFRFQINEGVGFGANSPFFRANFIRGRSYLDNNQSSANAQYFTVPAIEYKIRFLDGNDTLKATMDSTYYTFEKQKLYTLCLLGKYDSTHNYTTPDSLRLKIIVE